MSNQKVGGTAVGAAVCRHLEQYEPPGLRLFNDALAGNLAGTPIRLLMKLPVMRRQSMKQMDAITPGIYGQQVCRTRFIDEAVQRAVSDGLDQVVILGAGYDSRANRLAGMERSRAFEVDLPSVQSDKRKKLQKQLGRIPDHVTFIPIDFETQGLEAVFAGTAFDRTRPAVVAWEGVTQYISEEAVRRTLAFVGTLAPGSELVVTYVLKSVIERRSEIPGAGRMMDTVMKRSPWVFGLEPVHVADLLGAFHLDLVEDVGNADYQKKYLAPLKRTLVVSEVERIARAVVRR